MSWLSYIDDQLIGKAPNIIDKGAITDSAGTSVWASSADFDIATEELAVVVNLLKGDVEQREKSGPEGLYFCGERYALVICEVDGPPEQRYIYVAGTNKDGHKPGIFVGMTKQALVVAHHVSGEGNGNKARTTGMELVGYLVRNGY